MLFVNAGVANVDDETIADVSTEEFVRAMITNALSPLRVIESLRDLVHPTGTIGIMSSGQGSITNNENGKHDVYRGSKAALNMFMRSFAARHAADSRTLLLMAPGWVRTDMGGPQARLSIEESIPNLVNTIAAQTGKVGLQILGLPWAGRFRGEGRLEFPSHRANRTRHVQCRHLQRSSFSFTVARVGAGLGWRVRQNLVSHRFVRRQAYRPGPGYRRSRTKLGWHRSHSRTKT